MKSLMLVFLIAFELGLTQVVEKPFEVGLRIGEKIPPFRLVSQRGQEFDFKSLKGPKGLALLFVRSADW